MSNLRIRTEKGKVTVGQERCAKTMLERFQMDQIKPSSTLAYLYLKLQTAQNKDKEVDQNWITPVSGQIKKIQASRLQSTYCPDT